MMDLLTYWNIKAEALFNLMVLLSGSEEYEEPEDHIKERFQDVVFKDVRQGETFRIKKR